MAFGRGLSRSFFAIAPRAMPCLCHSASYVPPLEEAGNGLCEGKEKEAQRRDPRPTDVGGRLSIQLVMTWANENPPERCGERTQNCTTVMESKDVTQTPQRANLRMPVDAIWPVCEGLGDPCTRSRLCPKTNPCMGSWRAVWSPVSQSDLPVCFLGRGESRPSAMRCVYILRSLSTLSYVCEHHGGIRHL